MANVKWFKVKNQSLAIATRNVGFDLSVFQNYSCHVQEEIRALSIKEAVKLLKEDFYSKYKVNLSAFKKGVYVIRLSAPLSIQYEKDLSEIIYIGRGDVLTRLKAHYENSLFDFMQSLSGANFDFYISQPKKPGGQNYFKHVEHLLLEKFSQKYGGGDYQYPVLNKNAGSNQKNYADGSGWETPLIKAKKKPQWALRPTPAWNFARLDDSE